MKLTSLRIRLILVGIALETTPQIPRERNKKTPKEGIMSESEEQKNAPNVHIFIHLLDFLREMCPNLWEPPPVDAHHRELVDYAETTQVEERQADDANLLVRLGCTGSRVASDILACMQGYSITRTWM